MGTAIPRPVMRYHGGKFALAPWIIAQFPLHRVYVEPFGGAASVLLSKPRSAVEVYNDLDGAVVAVFRVLRDPKAAKELQRRLKLTAFARAELEWSYEAPADEVDQAHKTLVRSWLGHGTEAATRKGKDGLRLDKGDRSGPAYQAKEWQGFPALIPAFTARLAGVAIENTDAAKVIRKFDGPDALIYADPPYLAATRTTPGQAYRHEMTDDDHAKLATLLTSCQGAVIVSGYRSDLYEALYPGWRRIERPTTANMGKARVECLWLSPRCGAALQGDLFQGDFQ